MSILDLIAVDAFADSQEIEDNTNWSAGANTPVIDLNVIGIPNEKWLRAGSAFTGRYNGKPAMQAGDPQNEYEAHVLVHLTADSTGNATYLYLKNANSTTGEGLELRSTTSLAGAPNPGVLQVFHDKEQNDQTLNLPDFPTSSGSTFHVVLRVRGQSHASSNALALDDGIAEVWVNGILVYEDQAVDWGSSDTDRNWNLMKFTLGSGLSSTTYYRDVIIFDQWTSAPQVAPAVRHLTAGTISGVTAGTYTNEGGALDEVEALTDGLDTTFLKSAGVNDEVSIAVSVDPAVGSQNVESVVVIGSIGRAGAAFNDIEIELQDAAGATVLGTEGASISAISPARQSVVKQITPNASTTADDLSVVIRNGG